MAENSKIEWTDHTFNPWIGCTRVSPGCVHCYAETLAARFGKAEWGPLAKRVKTSAAYWKKPLKWNDADWWGCAACGWRGAFKATIAAGTVHVCPTCEGDIEPTRARVFCASLADVFEENAQVADWRGELFQLIERTPNLDWLILTKRPEKIFSLGTDAVGEVFDNWMARNPQVWLGTSVESADLYERRVKPLLDVYASVHFLSVEPMLTPPPAPPKMTFGEGRQRIDWVICGGESGAGCRPMEIEWARELLRYCRMGRVKFFMKQLGGHPRKRDRLEDFPEDLRVREYPDG
jgi:protein gp37